MSDAALAAMRDLVQQDVIGRGLRTDPEANLVNACPDDFAGACRSIAEHPAPRLAVVTGFYIPHASPPCGETDGPLGALFLARALTPLGIKVTLVTDVFCKAALQAGVQAAALQDSVPVLTFPPRTHPWGAYLEVDWRYLMDEGSAGGNPGHTHLIAVERVGPSHTPESARSPGLAAVAPPAHHDRCHNMRGVDITEHLAPAHLAFEYTQSRLPAVTTVGIGDGGNEIGMGKIPWDTVRRNIPDGGLVACRVPTDHLIVAGVSNWGAYALAAGVRLLRGAGHDPALFDPDAERELLEVMVERGPLVDGKTGQRAATVDGLPFDAYAEVLAGLGKIIVSGGRPSSVKGMKA